MSFSKGAIGINTKTKIIRENLKKAIDSSGRKKSGSQDKWVSPIHLYGDSSMGAENSKPKLSHK